MQPWHRASKQLGWDVNAALSDSSAQPSSLDDGWQVQPLPCFKPAWMSLCCLAVFTIGLPIGDAPLICGQSDSPHDLKECEEAGLAKLVFQSHFYEIWHFIQLGGFVIKYESQERSHVLQVKAGVFFVLFCLKSSKVSRVQMTLPESEHSSSPVLLPRSEPPHLSQHYLNSFLVSDLEFLLALCTLHRHQIKSPLCSNPSNVLQFLLKKKPMVWPWPQGTLGSGCLPLAPQSFPLLLSALAAAFAGNILPHVFTWLPLFFKCWLWCHLCASSLDCCT